MNTGSSVCLFAALSLAAAGDVTDDLESALQRAQEAANHHRFAEVIEILTPFNSIDDPEWRYISAAEIGRAYFHLGRYREAHRAFREAVSLHPDRAESAIYLQATSYLVGDREQALMIFEEILRSGARDLYLPVTLPGEKRFLADPEVRAVLSRHAVVLDVDIEEASVLEVALGDDRDRVEKTLGAGSTDGSAAALTASAGPAVIWAFVFDAGQHLVEIILHAENLLRYTPYRLRLGDGIDWRATPAAAMAAWGQPVSTMGTPDRGLEMTWKRPKHQLTLGFASPKNPRSAGHSTGAAVLRTVTLSRHPESSPDRITP